MSSILTSKNTNFHIQTGDKGDFNDAFGSKNSSWFSGEAQLSVDVFEDKSNIIIKSTVAGVNSENLEISISNDLLTIRGFREQDKEVDDSNYYCQECYWGAFSRSIILPCEVDQKKVDASITNGVLIIKLPKKYKTSSIKVKQIN
jgi:HSP20 family protein